MTTSEVAAVGLLVCGVALAFTALVLPPPGQIDSSVIYVFAQILIYCGSVFGVDSYINHKIKRRDANYKSLNGYD